MQYTVREQSRDRGSGGTIIGSRKDVLRTEEVDVSRRDLMKWNDEMEIRR